ncbi:hypothetical protein [Desulfonatronovibrio magnus]|uniref:hypothetical protein n=1 Tax=Desulfonatronovibrio magnus TaxID=698827 RepID=UPI0005EBBC38|nr:hypothetical protein [Desulfonatronovibrio magnus]
MNSKLQSATQVVRECFWGDYILSPQDILAKLESNDPGFNYFLFSKIIENSRYPSRHLSILFPKKDLHPMLQRYLRISDNNQRVRLVAANISGNYDLVPELQWKR